MLSLCDGNRFITSGLDRVTPPATPPATMPTEPGTPTIPAAVFTTAGAVPGAALLLSCR